MSPFLSVPREARSWSESYTSSWDDQQIWAWLTFWAWAAWRTFLGLGWGRSQEGDAELQATWTSCNAAPEIESCGSPAVWQQLEERRWVRWWRWAVGPAGRDLQETLQGSCEMGKQFLPALPSWAKCSSAPTEDLRADWWGKQGRTATKNPEIVNDLIGNRERNWPYISGRD